MDWPIYFLARKSVAATIQPLGRSTLSRDTRGDCYRSGGFAERAVRDYERALEVEPGNWMVKTRLSLAHYLKVKQRLLCVAPTRILQAKRAQVGQIYHLQIGQIYHLQIGQMYHHLQIGPI